MQNMKNAVLVLTAFLLLFPYKLMAENKVISIEVGNAFDDILSINKLVYKEMRHGKAWFKVRDEIPCKNCCNKSLCPSPSSYEIVTNRVNLCNIKK